MKNKKIAAAIVGATISISIFAGCAGNTAPNVTQSPAISASIPSDIADAMSPEPTDDALSSPAPTHDFAAAYAKYSPDTVMLTSTART